MYDNIFNVCSKTPSETTLANPTNSFSSHTPMAILFFNIFQYRLLFFLATNRQNHKAFNFSAQIGCSCCNLYVYICFLLSISIHNIIIISFQKVLTMTFWMIFNDTILGNRAFIKFWCLKTK